MTADEFRGKLKALGISQKWLADRLGVSAQTVNRWARGTIAVPKHGQFVLELLEVLYASDMLEHRAADGTLIGRIPAYGPNQRLKV